MKLACVCAKGFHNFNAHEMVDIIGAFQRGELSRVKWRKGSSVGIFPDCLAHADFNASKGTNVSLCGVLLENGDTCNLRRGHNEGRHEKH